jgi:hypothetical protein
MSPQRRNLLHRLIFISGLTAVCALAADATELQGVVVDWNCVKPMVRYGREKALRNNRGCSLMKNYDRAAYGLITDAKKFYRLEDPGNAKVKELLKNTPDKDNLKVVVNGDIVGETLKVGTISFL